MKIGELARRTGLSIRALRHYDDIGLLTPSARSEAAYRLYDKQDIARLYRIQALSRLDLSLAEIKSILEEGAATLPDVIAQQIAFLEKQMQQASSLRRHLLHLQVQLQADDEPSVDEWLIALESMANGGKYFNREELDKLKAGRVFVTASAETGQASLAIALHDLMVRGVPPEDAEARELAQAWITSMLAELDGDEGMLIKAYSMHWHESTLHTLTGIDQQAMTYIAHAMAYSRMEIYAKHCSPDEMAQLRAHYVQQTTAWPPLIAAVREQMEQGGGAGSQQVKVLARQWQALSLAKTGGNHSLQLKLQALFHSEPVLRLGSGINAPLANFIEQAIATLETN
ncbi:MerR family transcriptional regulator [Undibacterium sp.]|uniref:MerR family transcriptional regulator n=1 Tax=Undibacterium sp. TaxID=1914977 RepID=UPI00374C8C5E